MNPLSKTIAAVSTPRGKGGIAVIRISGKDAIKVAGEMFRPARAEHSGAELSSADARTALYGAILGANGEEIDRGICTVFVAPASFTGEDSAEISCHGGPAVTEAVYMSALAHGAVAADAGEFTKRAFLSGKLSLTEAEAVGRLVDADTEERMKLSGGAMRGSVSRELKRLSDSLLGVMTALYAAIDYPEEDVGDEGEREIGGTLQGALDGVEHLLATYKLGSAIQTGVRCVICGKPNVGKSSLFNLITGEDAAIVTSIAGTTRDVLRETVSFGGVTLRLSDTAGIRRSEDEVERMGVERAGGEIERAELVIAVFDGSRSLDAEDFALIERIKDVRAPVVAVINKADLGCALTADELSRASEYAACTVSCAARSDFSESGRGALSDAIAEICGAGDFDISSDAVIWDVRQREILLHAKSALSEACAALSSGGPLDAVCTLAEEALAALNETDGRGVGEEIVNEIFKRFCVGK